MEDNGRQCICIVNEKYFLSIKTENHVYSYDCGQVGCTVLNAFLGNTFFNTDPVLGFQNQLGLKAVILLKLEQNQEGMEGKLTGLLEVTGNREKTEKMQKNKQTTPPKPK